MKKIIISIILIVIVIVAFIGYQYYHYQNNLIEQKKLNADYESYYEKEILGTTIISIMNKTINVNEKNGIQKDEKGYFINNKENSIQIEIKFKDNDSLYKMEQISKQGSENFVKNYAGMSFKCTKLEYHEKTKIVSYLLFEEI